MTNTHLASPISRSLVKTKKELSGFSNIFLGFIPEESKESRIFEGLSKQSTISNLPTLVTDQGLKLFMRHRKILRHLLGWKIERKKK